MKTINDVKLRIEKLRKKPVEKFRLIKKWKRIFKQRMKKCQSGNAC